MPAGAGAFVAALLCTAAAISCGYQLFTEARIAGAFAAINSDTPVAKPPAPIDARTVGGSPREQLYTAIAQARAAAALAGTSPQRSRLIAAARQNAANARADRPRWGEASVVEAFIATLDQGNTAPAARAALARSYQEAAFLPDSAEWRIQMAIINWPALPRPIQDIAAREAVLLARTSRPMALHVRIMTTGTPIYDRYGGVIWPKSFSAAS